MKVQYPLCATGRIVEAEGATLADAFRDLARLVEVFGETHCGVCGVDDIAPVAREAGGHEFFEWRCLNPKCGATMKLGTRDDKANLGRLFPVRKLDAQGRPDWKDGTAGPHRGWTTYHGPGTEAPPAGPRTPAPGPRTTASSSSRPTASASASAAAPWAAPPSPTADPPADPDAKITSGQWAEIQRELRVWGISDRAFLDRYAHTSPREIRAAHFVEALDAAKHPDEKLIALDKANRAGKAGRQQTPA